jgi:hypothetical protein
MGACQQSSVTKLVQILADGLRGNVKTLRQIIDLDGARGPRKGKDLVLARAQLGHVGIQENLFASLFSFFFTLSNTATQYFPMQRTMLSLTFLLTFIFFRLILQQGSNKGATLVLWEDYR